VKAPTEREPTPGVHLRECSLWSVGEECTRASAINEECTERECNLREAQRRHESTEASAADDATPMRRL